MAQVERGTPGSDDQREQAQRIRHRIVRVRVDPVGDVDGDITARAKQALCAWRETHGLPVNRAGLNLTDAYSVLNATKAPVPTRAPGIYLNKTCQVLYQIVGKTYKRIVWVSTGGPGYDTPNRTGKVWRKWAGAHESSLYEAGPTRRSLKVKQKGWTDAEDRWQRRISARAAR